MQYQSIEHLQFFTRNTRRMFSLIAEAMKVDIKDPLAKWMLVTLADYALSLIHI